MKSLKEYMAENSSFLEENNKVNVMTGEINFKPNKSEYQGDTQLKELNPEQIDAIKRKHWKFLDDLQSILFNNPNFSAEEKYNIFTDFQNRIEMKIEAEVYVNTINQSTNDKR